VRRNISILLEIRIIVTAKTKTHCFRITNFTLPYRSARTPTGNVNKIMPIAFIMIIELMSELVNPKDIKYSCKTTLAIPLANPLRIDRKRNNLAGVEILFGIID
jgi:hypothetical protein